MKESISISLNPTTSNSTTKPEESTPLTVIRTPNISITRRCKIHGVVDFLDDADYYDRILISSVRRALVIVYAGATSFLFGVMLFSGVYGAWPITSKRDCYNTTIDGNTTIDDDDGGNFTTEGITTQSSDPGFPDQLEINQTRGGVLLWLQLAAMIVTSLLLLLARSSRCPDCLSFLLSFISFFCFLIGAVMLLCCVVWPMSLEMANCVSTYRFFLGTVCFVTCALSFFGTGLGMASNISKLRDGTTNFCGCCSLGGNRAYENL